MNRCNQPTYTVVVTWYVYRTDANDDVATIIRFQGEDMIEAVGVFNFQRKLDYERRVDGISRKTTIIRTSSEDISDDIIGRSGNK